MQNSAVNGPTWHAPAFTRDLQPMLGAFTDPQNPLRLAYGLGFYDGQKFASNVVLSAAFAPRVAYDFLKAVGARYSDRVVAQSVGLFDRQLYVWLFVEDIDVPFTRELYSLKAALEENEAAQFEMHVKPLQGRQPVDVMPTGFHLVQF